MDAEKEKIDWVIRFAAVDFATLRPGDKLNLLSELHEWFVFSDPARLVVLTHVPLAESRETELRRFWQDLHRLQGQVRDFLNGLVDTARAYGVGIPQAPIKAVTLSLHASPTRPEGQVSLSFSAPWRAAFLMTLVLRLWQVGIANVRRCPTCQTIFLRRHRQRYCSRTCTTKANWREWAKTHRPRKRRQPTA